MEWYLFACIPVIVARSTPTAALFSTGVLQWCNSLSDTFLFVVPAPPALPFLVFIGLSLDLCYCTLGIYVWG